MSLIMSSIIGESSGGSGACIDISTRPNRLNYKEGERLDLTGMVVELYEKGKEPVRIEGYDTIPSDGAVLTKNDDVVVIKYKKDGALFKTMLPIDIIYPVGIEVTALDKKIYKPDEGVDLAGLRVVINYNDNTSELIDNNEGITTNPSKGIEIRDNKSIEFSYVINGKTYKTLYRVEDYYEKDYDKSISQTWQRYLCTFANGTQDDIAAMLNAARSGYFKISDYWKIGDTRDLDYNFNVGSEYYTRRNDRRDIRYDTYTGSIKLVIIDFKLPKSSKNKDKYNEVVVITYKNAPTYVVNLKDLFGNINNGLAITYSGTINFSPVWASDGTRYTCYNTSPAYGVRPVYHVYKCIDNFMNTAAYIKYLVDIKDSIHIPVITFESTQLTQLTSGWTSGQHVNATITKQVETEFLGLYVSNTNEAGVPCKFSLIRKEHVFGDDAFVYFKTSSNRIYYDANTNQPQDWFLLYNLDLSDKIGTSFGYTAESRYVDSKNEYNIKYDRNQIPMYLRAEYVNTSGELETYTDHILSTIKRDAHIRPYIALA